MGEARSMRRMWFRNRAELFACPRTRYLTEFGPRCLAKAEDPGAGLLDAVLGICVLQAADRSNSMTSLIDARWSTTFVKILPSPGLGDEISD